MEVPGAGEAADGGAGGVVGPELGSLRLGQAMLEPALRRGSVVAPVLPGLDSSWGVRLRAKWEFK